MCFNLPDGFSLTEHPGGKFPVRLFLLADDRLRGDPDEAVSG